MSQPRRSSALRRARRALRKAQRALDLADWRLGDLWAVLDSWGETLELWMEDSDGGRSKVS